MLKYTLKRLAMAIPVIWGIVTIVFVLMRVFSANPAYLMLGQRATADRVAEVTTYLGLDQPIWKQYLIYLQDLMHHNSLSLKNHSSKSRKPFRYYTILY